MRVQMGVMSCLVTSARSHCRLLFQRSSNGSNGNGKFPVINFPRRCRCYSALREGTQQVLNRLVYRSKQRGLLELDVLLGTWAQKHLKTKSRGFLVSYSAVLDEESPELFKWLTGQERPPPRVANNDAFDQIYEHVTKILLKNSDEASRTCPGRSWLRGWDNWSPEAHEKNSRS